MLKKTFTFFVLQEAIVIIVDVGPSMNQAPVGESTSLETSLDAINMILQRKVWEFAVDQIKHRGIYV